MTAGVPEINKMEMGWGEHIMQKAGMSGRRREGEGRHPFLLGKLPTRQEESMASRGGPPTTLGS